jgi:uncharacterized phiE125 gp8 family phage protein
MALRQIAQPAATPISVAQLKAQCRIDAADEDAYLDSLIRRATKHLEVVTWRAFVTQQWKLTGTHLETPLVVPKGRLQSIVSFGYTDTEGTFVAFANDDYVADVNADPGEIRPPYGTAWPAVRTYHRGFDLVFQCGFGAAEDVPEDLRHAVALLASFWWHHRGTEASLPNLDGLLQPWMLRDQRVMRFL